MMSPTENVASDAGAPDLKEAGIAVLNARVLTAPNRETAKRFLTTLFENIFIIC